MTDEADRIRALAQSEFHAHSLEYTRLERLASMVMDSMEFHAAQMANWTGYLAEIAIQEGGGNVVPFPRHEPTFPGGEAS